MRRLRHNPSLIVVERHRSRLSRGGSPGARERAPRRGGGRRALGPPRDGLALILANKTARARARRPRARAIGRVDSAFRSLLVSRGGIRETPPSPVVNCRSGLEKKFCRTRSSPFPGSFVSNGASFLPPPKSASSARIGSQTAGVYGCGCARVPFWLTLRIWYACVLPLRLPSCCTSVNAAPYAGGAGPRSSE